MRKAWLREPPMIMSEWAQAKRVIHVGPSKGRFENETFPLGAEIMDTICDPDIEEVNIVGPRQTAKTVLAVENPFLYFCLYQGRDVLIVYPSDEHCRRVWLDRLLPAIYASPELRALLKPRHERGTLKEGIKFKNGKTLYMVGAGSLANLTQFSVEIVIMDEIDYWFSSTGNLSQAMIDKTYRAIDMAIGRADAYPMTRKIIRICTVTTPEGPIWQEYLKGDQRKPWVPCPRCGRFQILAWDGALIDQEQKGGLRPVEPESEVAALQETYYKCAHCEEKILGNESDKRDMLRGHRWLKDGQEINHEGATTGEYLRKSTASFWYSRLYSPWWMFGPLARTRYKQLSNLEDFQKHAEVIPWVPPDLEIERLSDDQLVARSGRRRGVMPPEADFSIFSMDVHKKVLYWVAIAFQKEGRTAWLLDNGTMKTGLKTTARGRFITTGDLEQIKSTLAEAWEIKEGGWPRAGETVKPKLMCIDAGYAPAAVDAFCLEAGLIDHVPIIGLGSEGPAAFRPQKHRENLKPGQISSNHAYSVLTPERIRRINVDSDWGKHQVHRALSTPIGAAGCLYLHEDITTSIKKHLMAEEYRIDETTNKGEWHHLSGRPNHYLDCFSYAMIMADALGAKVLSAAEVARKKKSITMPTGPERTGREMDTRELDYR